MKSTRISPPAAIAVAAAIAMAGAGGRAQPHPGRIAAAADLRLALGGVVGRLAVWVPAASPLDVEKNGLQVLVDPRVLHVSIANPATAPYGRAAEAAMRRAAAYDRVRPQLLLGGNAAHPPPFLAYRS